MAAHKLKKEIPDTALIRNALTVLAHLPAKSKQHDAWQQVVRIVRELEKWEV